ncbi:UNVERIFIED_CONTAM: hypothetical protein GTU68_008999 [Idotea baltica]|nr:hypothetical protein [Idotea baltica]
MIEENQNTIKQLKQENLERYKDLDQRISSESSSGISQKTKGGTASSSTKEAASTADNSSADPAKEKLYYDASFDFIKTKDFDKATKAFNAFLRKYPDSKYAGNAQYWLGEVSLATNDLPSAQKNFAKVSKSYPEHSKVPDSLYKLGDVEVRLGNKDKAKTIFQQVVSKYPNTSAAKLSQNELKQL